MAQTDSLLLSKLREEILNNSTCYENLGSLTKTVGNRITGSRTSIRAIQWGMHALKMAGADAVIAQQVWVTHWMRGAESLKVKLPGSKVYVPMNMLSLGNSIGSGTAVEAPILMVQNMDEFNALSPDKVAGHIVFFNYRFRKDMSSSFEAYGDAIKYRALTPTVVAQKGGAGVIIRSLSTGDDDQPHTGMTRMVDSIRKIPAAAIGNKGADRLEVACRKGEVMAQLTTSGKLEDSVMSYNVVGEIKGSQYPDEYIVVGGHLDSWDVGEGAHDDGAGCVQSIEVLRAIKAIGLKPARTIRVVLFMNEENGARGGVAYADSARVHHEKHILALESDAGGFSPRGIGLEMPADKKAIINSWVHWFEPLHATDFSREEGGTDIGPLAKLGTPLAGLNPDPTHYFDYHHSARDVFENVDKKDLAMGAAVMASLVLLVSEHGL